MFIDEINSLPDATMKLSCLDPETKASLDFDIELLADKDAKNKLDAFLQKKGIPHYLLVENVIYDKKRIDFSSHAVVSSLYLTMKTGKTYRWQNVGVNFMKVGDVLVTCIITKQNATPYNRRDTFRIPVDKDGFVTWEGRDMPERCVVKDVSHDGFGISMTETKINLLKGLTATISWEETAVFSGDRPSTRTFKATGKVTRRKTRLEGDMIIGFKMEDEPDGIREYIQWAQTHRGFSKEGAKPTMMKGVQKQENWQLEKQLADMAGES